MKKMRKPIKNVRKDKKVFSNTADKTKAVNLGRKAPRGGIRF